MNRARRREMQAGAENLAARMASSMFDFAAKRGGTGPRE